MTADGGGWIDLTADLLGPLFGIGEEPVVPWWAWVALILAILVSFVPARPEEPPAPEFPDLD